MLEVFFSRSSERNEGVLTELCVGRTVSSRPSIIAGRQGSEDAENQPVSSQGVRDADMILLPTGAVVPPARIRLL